MSQIPQSDHVALEPRAAPGGTRPELGELLVRVDTDMSYTSVPHAFVKKTRTSKVDHPLPSIAAIRVDGRVRAACSGVGAAPFRSVEIEGALNSPELSLASRIDQALERPPSPIIDDILGSGAYREFVLRSVLEDIIAELGGVS
jgi:xanthine dehydrogenase molybdenum-binding subunit